MSFLAPWVLAVGALAALGIVALHLLSTRRPPRAVLPTARFVPESEARAVSRSAKPTDLLLLVCRVLAVLLIAAAFARPVPDAPGPRERTVHLVDISASSTSADLRGIGFGVAEGFDEGDAVVVFDTSARVLDDPVGTLGAMDTSQRAPRPAPGILSAALVAGVREARRIARGADSVRLTLTSPLAEELFDAATPSARAAWPGGILLSRVPGESDTARGPDPQLDTPLADDPIAPAIRRLDAARGDQLVRIVRRSLDASDSAWAREAGRVLVHWPLADGATVRADAVIAFGLRAATIVAPLARIEMGLDTGPVTGGRVIARWRDDAIAAMEHPIGAGCIRDVNVGIPLAGDLTLRPAFEAFLAVMVEPCGGARGRFVDDSTATAFSGGSGAVGARSLVAAGESDRNVAAMLLAAALLALAAEWYVRQRRAT